MIISMHLDLNQEEQVILHSLSNLSHFKNQLKAIFQFIYSFHFIF